MPIICVTKHSCKKEKAKHRYDRGARGIQLKPKDQKKTTKKDRNNAGITARRGVA